MIDGPKTKHRTHSPSREVRPKGPSSQEMGPYKDLVISPGSSVSEAAPQKTFGEIMHGVIFGDIKPVYHPYKPNEAVDYGGAADDAKRKEACKGCAIPASSDDTGN